MKKLPIFLLVGALVALASCKPTEEAYRKAYEIAQTKRATEEADPYTGMVMVREGDPVWKVVDGDSLLYVRQPLMRLEGDSLHYKPYNVAVAQYKMKTTAVAHAERLRTQGYDSRVFRNPGQYYITVAAQLDSVSEVVPFMRRYMKDHPRDTYTGFPGRPVLTIPTALTNRL